jgi:hypothetical protein
MGPKQSPDNIPPLRTLRRPPSPGTVPQRITPRFVFTRWKSKVVKLPCRDTNKERKRCKNLAGRRYLSITKRLSKATRRTQRRSHEGKEKEERQNQNNTAHTRHRVPAKIRKQNNSTVGQTMREMQQRHAEQWRGSKLCQDSVRNILLEDKEKERIMQYNNEENVTRRSQVLGLYFRAYTERGDESYNAVDIKHILQAVAEKGYPIGTSTIEDIGRAVRQAKTPQEMEAGYNMGNNKAFRWGLRIPLNSPVAFQSGHGAWQLQKNEHLAPMTASYRVDTQQGSAKPPAQEAPPPARSKEAEDPTPREAADDGYTLATVGKKRTAGPSYATAVTKPEQGRTAREKRVTTPREVEHMTRQLKAAAVSGGGQTVGVEVTVVCGPPVGVRKLQNLATYFGLPESLAEAENQALLAMRRSILKLMQSKEWDAENIMALEERLYLYWEVHTRRATQKGQNQGATRASCRVLKADLGSEDGAEDKMVVAIQRAIFSNGHAMQVVEVAEGGFNLWATQGGIPYPFCHTDQREKKGQPLVARKQCHVITSTVVHIKEELRPLASRRLGTALYAVDEASEGAILQIEHLKKRMFIIMNTKAGAVDIANLLSEHAAAFKTVTGSAMTAWKPEGGSKGAPKAQDAAPIRATMARLQAKWNPTHPLPPAAHINRDAQQQDTKDPQGGEQTSMDVEGDADTPGQDTMLPPVTPKTVIRGSLGVQAIVAAGLERVPEGYLDPSQNFRLRETRGEWTIEFQLDEDMDQGAPNGYCGLAATRTSADRKQHGKAFGVVDAMRELRKLNKDPGALCSICGNTTHAALMVLQSKIEAMPTELPTLPTAAQFTGTQMANICGGSIMTAQVDHKGGRWRSLAITGYKGQLLSAQEILERIREMREHSVLDISQNHCEMLDWGVIVTQLAPILSRLGTEVSVRVGLSTTQKEMFAGRMRGKQVRRGGEGKETSSHTERTQRGGNGQEARPANGPGVELAIDYDEWLMRPISECTLTFAEALGYARSSEESEGIFALTVGPTDNERHVTPEDGACTISSCCQGEDAKERGVAWPKNEYGSASKSEEGRGLPIAFIQRVIELLKKRREPDSAQSPLEDRLSIIATYYEPPGHTVPNKDWLDDGDIEDIHQALGTPVAIWDTDQSGRRRRLIRPQMLMSAAEAADFMATAKTWIEASPSHYTCFGHRV